jgi:hypothetical protein
MLVPVSCMRRVIVAVMNVVDMVLVPHRVVAAAFAVLVHVVGVLRVRRRALVPVSIMPGVRVSVVDEVGVAAVHDRGVAAVGTVLVAMVSVFAMLDFGHRRVSACVL